VVVRQVDGLASQPPQRFTEVEFFAFVRRQLGEAEQVHSCYEAGPFGYVLHRRLTALGVHNLVVRPRDWSTYGERVKTDGRDAGALCSSLDRHLCGNRGALAVVRVPTEEEEALRGVSRQRQSLVRDRVRCRGWRCRPSGGASGGLPGWICQHNCASSWPLSSG
jgi:transposase